MPEQEARSPPGQEKIPTSSVGEEQNEPSLENLQNVILEEESSAENFAGRRRHQ
jgi:hypothetical protein